MLGIENLEKLVVSVGKLGSHAGSILEDKKFNQEDLDEVIGIVMEAPSLLQVSYKDALKEIQDIDGEEKEKLGNLFVANFDLPADNLEEAIEDGFIIILGVLKFIKVFIKKPAAEPTPA